MGDRDATTAGWIEVETMRLDLRLGLILTGWSFALVALALGVILAVAPALGALLVDSRGATWVAGIVLTSVVHEWLHGLAAASFGARPRYGVGLAGVLPYFYCSTGTSFSRNQFVVVSLTPLVVLNAIALVALLSPATAPLGAVVLAMNTTGAVGDLWGAWRTLQHPSSVRVLDANKANLILAPTIMTASGPSPRAVPLAAAGVDPA